MEPLTLYIVLAVANIPVYIFIGWFLFEDWSGFFEALGYWFQPDSWSWLKGEGFDDFIAELKLFFFLALCAAAVFGEFWLINKYFPGVISG